MGGLLSGYSYEQVLKIDLLDLSVEDPVQARSNAIRSRSARKLKRGGANLLAGRAFVYNLFPFNFLELGDRFDIDYALHWGKVPAVYLDQSDDDRT